MNNKTKTISSINDICDALNELYNGIVITDRHFKKLRSKVSLMFTGGVIFAGLLELQIKNLEQRMNDQKEIADVKEMQSQLDAQEEKILQLELELEDLRKKE
jgi:DNA-binding NarL/FixJ family response regulator